MTTDDDKARENDPAKTAFERMLESADAVTEAVDRLNRVRTEPITHAQFELLLGKTIDDVLFRAYQLHRDRMQVVKSMKPWKGQRDAVK